MGCFRLIGPGLVRIGGNSIENNTWNPSGSGGQFEQIAPSDIDGLAAFLKATGWQVLYGIGLANNTSAAAASEAAYVAGACGSSLYGFEIGNEPDLYSKNGLRPAGYNVADFDSEWANIVSAIKQSVPTAVLTGPATAYDLANWTSPFVAAEGSQIQLVTDHYYRGDGLSSTSTVALLLEADPALPKILQDLLALSRNTRDGYRLAECASYYNGGALNVSDTYGTALWAADLLLLAASYGANGVNFHGGGDSNGYTPIADNGTSVVEARPVYYGMLFAKQIPTGPMLQTMVTSALSLTAYAIDGSDGSTYVAVINKDAAVIATTNIALGTSATSAESLTLSGQGITATEGTVLGASSVTNVGTWNPLYEPVLVNGSTITLKIAPATAVLLKIS
jgi:hypothetical protein